MVAHAQLAKTERSSSENGFRAKVSRRSEGIFFALMRRLWSITANVVIATEAATDTE
jgi:hypothetical protein